MSNEDLKKKIMDAARRAPMASFATIRDGKPWVRYVMVSMKDNLDLYFTASKLSRKVSQIHANPHCHILLGADPKDMMAPYIQVQGTAEMIEDLAVKKEYWVDYHARMFKGPEDSNFIVIRVKPEIIEFWGEGKMEPQVYALAHA
jgi:general stress protein 26